MHDNKNLRIIRNNSIAKFFKRFLGIRMLKTALAVSLSLVIADSLDLRLPMMAALAAVVTMTTSVFDSITSSINRLISTIIGVVIAAIFRQVGLTGFLPMFIGILIIINICNYMKWHNATTLAIMIFTIVMLYIPSAPDYLSVWQYGLNRLIDTSVGLIIGLLVNIIILPPNQSEFILRNYQRTLADCEEAFLQSVNGEQVDVRNIIRGINSLTDELENIKHDGPFSKKRGIKYSQLHRINSKFYTVAGSITQLSDTEIIPCLNEENKNAINNYFGEEIEFENADTCPVEVENAYNVQISYNIRTLHELRDDIHELDEKMKKAS